MERRIDATPIRCGNLLKLGATSSAFFLPIILAAAYLNMGQTCCGSNCPPPPPTTTEYEGYLCQVQFNPSPGGSGGGSGQYGYVWATIHSQPACQGQVLTQISLCSTGADSLTCYTDRLYDSQRTLSILFEILRDHEDAGRKIIANVDDGIPRTNDFFLLAEQ